MPVESPPAPAHPRLLAVVDTEEEFDWSEPFSREATSVDNIQYVQPLQDLFERHSVAPTYVVDYPVATQASAWGLLRQFLEEGRAAIGAHLHPWVTPPFHEEVSARNSYGGNLDRDLEFAKLSTLTDQIEKNFCYRPRVFKAGRFGVGPNTLSILAELGYEADLSPGPPQDCSEDGGPDFTMVSCRPFRDRDTGIFVIPGTGAFCGWLPEPRAAVHRWATTGWRKGMHVHSLLWRSGAARRLWLSPESFSSADMAALARSLHRDGLGTFVVSLHSSVMLPGATAFAPDRSGVERVLERLQSFFEFFFGELGGEPWTIAEALACWSGDAQSLPARSQAACADQVT